MTVIRSHTFTAQQAWGSLPVASIDGVSVKLHWTDKPYVWHVNDGKEVFAVMDGCVAMHVRTDGVERVEMLNAGDVFYADIGTEHVAHPQGQARVLVIEREGSM
ncbi:MAG: cupin [Burkholderiaceae bacterium]|jgi:mannose-6-phosphate isomerase-like protein (cupin superfamily)|nr:cupin [Burkholderiaceae bacterium]